MAYALRFIRVNSNELNQRLESQPSYDDWLQLLFYLSVYDIVVVVAAAAAATILVRCVCDKREIKVNFIKWNFVCRLSVAALSVHILYFCINIMWRRTAPFVPIELHIWVSRLLWAILLSYLFIDPIKYEKQQWTRNRSGNYRKI